MSLRSKIVSNVLVRLCLPTVAVAVLVGCGTAPSSQTAGPPSGTSPTSNTKTGYYLANKFTIGGDPGWDYVAIDPDARRVYVTHYMKIEVLDADTGKSIGQITDTPAGHG